MKLTLQRDNLLPAVLCVMMLFFAMTSLHAQWGKMNADFNGNILAVGVYNNNLYAGGLFSSPVSRFARYNGTDWVSVEFPETDGYVTDMTVFGASLIVAHYNTSTGLGRLYNYNGVSWGLIASSTGGIFKTLAVLNNELYVGGSFISVTPTFGAPVTASNLVKYDDVSWSAVMDGGIGPDQSVNDLVAHGDWLYVAGQFNNLDKIVAWDGVSWQPLTTPTTGPGVNIAEYITAISFFNEELYVTGEFGLKGTAAVQRIAKYHFDSETWSTLPFSLHSPGSALHVHDNELYIGFLGTNISTETGVNGILRWDGTSAKKLSYFWNGAWFHGLQGVTRCMTSFGSDLVVGGSFDGYSGDLTFQDGFRLVKWTPCLNLSSVPNIVGGTKLVPGGNNIEFSVPATAGVTNYNWSSNSGYVTVAGGQGTNTAAFNVNLAITPVPTDVNIQMVPSSGCEVGPAKSLTVTVKSNPVITISNFNKTYVDAVFASDAISSSPGAITYSSNNNQVASVGSTTGLITINGVGTAVITVNQAESISHWESSKDFSVTVEKASLTATADNKSRSYGDTNPATTITFAGFKNGETTTVLDTPPTAAIAGTATSTSNAGTTHTITVEGGTDNNYTFNPVNGTLTINKASITATAENKDREYGSANPATQLHWIQERRDLCCD